MLRMNIAIDPETCERIRDRDCVMCSSAQTIAFMVDQACNRGDRMLQILNFLVAALGGVSLLSIFRPDAPKVLVPQRAVVTRMDERRGNLGL